MRTLGAEAALIELLERRDVASYVSTLGWNRGRLGCVSVEPV